MKTKQLYVTRTYQVVDDKKRIFHVIKTRDVATETIGFVVVNGEKDITGTEKDEILSEIFQEKVIVSIKGGMVVDVVAPSDIDVHIRDYDTPIAIDRNYVGDEKAASYKEKIDVDEDGDEYVEEIW